MSDKLNKMLIVGGTSLSVWPACTYVQEFRGEHLVIINKEKISCPINDETDIIIVGSLGDVFTEIEKIL